MILLEKTDQLLSFDVNAAYFKKFGEVSCGAGSHSRWQTAALGTSIFTIDHHYYSNDELSGERFLEYKARMTCKVIIENEKQDALQILSLVKESHEFMNEYIKNHALSYASKLKIFDYQINPHTLQRMESSIAQLNDMPLHEDKTEFQLRIEREFMVPQLEVKTII